MTRVAIIRPDESMFWQSLARLLEIENQVEVAYFASPHELSASGAERPADIAIVPWSRSDDAYPWLTRLGKPDCRAVIGIDSTTNESVVWAQQVSRSTVLGLSHLLGGSQSRRIGDPNLGSGIAARSPERSGRPQSDERTRALVKWAELMVRARLVDLATDSASEAVHLPGWTASLGHVRGLMGAQFDETRETIRPELHQLDEWFEPEGLVAPCGGLRLGELEQRILALAVVPELDGRFHFAYGYLHNDMTRGYASAALLADLLGSADVDAVAIWRALFADGLISRLKLLEAEAGPDGRSGPESPLRVPIDLIEFMTQGRVSEAALGPALNLAADQSTPIPDTCAAAEMHAAIEHGPRPQLVQLIGRRPAFDWAGSIVAAAGRQPLAVDVSRLGGDDYGALDRFAAKVARVARLVNAIPILEGAREGGRLARDLAVLVLRGFDSVVVDLEQPWTPPASIFSRVIEPFAGSSHMTATDWRTAARMYGIEIDEADAVELAATRRDDPALAASVCRQLSDTCGTGTLVDLRSLRAAARSLSAPPDAGLLRRIQPVFDWNDIVLPDDCLEQLRNIPLHVRHAARVLDEWGYAARLPLGQGVAALFAGPSGTGKTMAAQIVAAELGVDVFQVDLAKTVSKYIGETEKHLNQAFADAERASAVLLFDEADALFGKRTEVKDAHDRYANVEVAYLLQRLEQFRGVVILTTNFRQNMDAAFIRRLRFIIDFPQPDCARRLEIWKRASPTSAPGWSQLDFTYLAQRFQLTGGHIQQIAVAAAFLAAAEAGGGQPEKPDDERPHDHPAEPGDQPVVEARIEMRHILRATRQQLMKLGMVSAGKTVPENGESRGARSA